MIHVSIVQSNEILREALSCVLSGEADIEVVYAGSCRPCLGSDAPSIPHVVIADDDSLNQQIPSVDGGCNLVIFSANSDIENIIRAFNLGAKAYVLQGTSIELLISAVRAVAHGASWLDPVIAKRTIQYITDVHSSLSCDGFSASLLGSLTTRENDVLSCLCEGMSNHAISQKLYLTNDTVKTHVRHILEKLHAGSRTEAAIYALRAGYPS